MDPTGIVVRGFYLRPGERLVFTVPYDVYRRSQKGLGHHIGIKFGSAAHVADGNVHHSVFLCAEADETQCGES